MIRVLLFARLREIVGRDVITLTLPARATAASVKASISEQYPAACSLVQKCALAVNNEFVADDAYIPPDAEVALLPPVSGG